MPDTTASQGTSPSKVLTWVMTHRKALVAYGGVAVMLLTLAFPHATWLPFIISAAAALGVQRIPNARP